MDTLSEDEAALHDQTLDHVVAAASLLAEPRTPAKAAGKKRRRPAAASELNRQAHPAGSRRHLFDATEVARALSDHPELSLEAHNAAPTLRWARWGFAVLRMTNVPAAPGVAIDPRTATVPFPSLKSLAQPVIAALGVADVHRHIGRAIASLRAARASPTPVLVPIALLGLPEDDREADATLAAAAAAVAVAAETSLRPMLFLPEPAGGGWLVTEERWEG